MIFHRIQNRLILLFVIMASAILLGSGGLLRWSIRQNLEAELGRKLMAVAGSASVWFDEDELSLLSDTGPRSRNRLRARLEKLRGATQVERIYFFDLSGVRLLDTHPRGSGEFFNLQFFAPQIQSVGQGESAYSILFKSLDGQPAMTGFAPLLSDGRVTGGVGVEGSVPFLMGMRRMENRLFIIGGFGLLSAVILGIVLARSITRPIHQLAAASKRIGRGEYERPISGRGEDEIGQLARTMDEMRRSIIQREKTLKAMLAGVAHEIRNPLGGIELFAGLLADEVSGQEQAQSQVARISRETAHLKEIVNSFLSYARPQPSRPQTCSVKEAIGQAQELLQPRLSEKSIALHLEKVPDGSVIQFDAHHLQRVLLNLMGNGIQAMDSGGAITFSMPRERCLQIADTGGGIPQEIQPEVFEPFFTTRSQGTGLGLSIVKQLVEANHSDIRILTSNEHGTVFEINFGSQ